MNKQEKKESLFFKSQLSHLPSFLTELNLCTSKSNNFNPLFRAMSASQLLVIGSYFMVFYFVESLTNCFRYSE